MATKYWVVETYATATYRYYIKAKTEEEAEEKYYNGDYIGKPHEFCTHDEQHDKTWEIEKKEIPIPIMFQKK